MKALPVKYLKGVGPQREEILQKELGIFYFHELLFHFPFRYINRSKIFTLEELYRMPEDEIGSEVQVMLWVKGMELKGEKRSKRLVAECVEGNRKALMVWFQGHQWVSKRLQAGKRYLIFGKPGRYQNLIQFAHPEFLEEEKLTAQNLPRFMPVYNPTETMKRAGLDSDGLFGVISNGIRMHLHQTVDENLPESIRKKYFLMNRLLAFEKIHLPDSEKDIHHATRRLKWEELFFIQLQLGKILKNRKKYSVGIPFTTSGDLLKEFYEKHLPFPLTDDQKAVIREMYEDMRSGRQMNRLLQGDVGSGKTIVALILMLIAIGNDCQACLMVPTEILAQQHYHNIRDILKGLPVRVALLTGSTKKQPKQKIYEELQSGQIQLLIGTHALIEEQVKFKKLGLAVIDEQHRFGVAQRAKLSTGYNPPPHVLIMSATPIPRTLALTLYGDLDVSVIRQLPAGRKPVKTFHVYENARLRVIGMMREQIAKGRQVYVVFPLIQESEKLDYHNLEKGFEGIVADFPEPQYHVGMVHGRMSEEDREHEMRMFAEGKTNILVATTVIEVGVNVPNATMMVIESAERFGLSQLHQLRGRVGRGSEESYCILMTGHKLSREARRRMEAMVQTTDGFKISEMDLELRGPGEMSGTRQSGTEKLKIANLITDGPLLKEAREAALELLDDDPSLEKPEHACIREFLSQKQEVNDWTKVG
ncbi:MAG: ATP-dependent DNA helicase RecG [Bacteroidia bacterium]|nr:ATP-dependent DNA helicase RecG [Bacteroidia bacterium]